MDENAHEGVTAGWFAENLRDAREKAGLSQDALASIMSDLGYAFRQQTITRIEGGERRVEVGEAFALARSVGTSVEALMRPAGVARDGLRILDAVRRVHQVQQAVRKVYDSYNAERRDLEALVNRAERSGHAKGVAREIALGRRALSSTEAMPAGFVTAVDAAIRTLVHDEPLGSPRFVTPPDPETSSTSA